MQTRSRHRWLLIFLLFLLLIFCGITGALLYLEQSLPEVESLKTVQMQVPLRIFSADGNLIGEFGEKKRIPVTLQDVPPLLVQAIIATEDKRFWAHGGVDFIGLARASWQLLLTREKTQGGSTITMQVARNFFLSSKKTYGRKLREILLAIKIGRELPKEKILELYLNKVYLGQRAYGVAAAAQVYYGKSLPDLDLAQIATIAGLPKAPSSINPIVNPRAALERRHHVLLNMLEQGYINQAQFQTANKEPIATRYHPMPIAVRAPYIAEEVRDELIKQYGNTVYENGLTVYTTIDSHLQEAANLSVRHAALSYDKRHGYRGPLAHWDNVTSGSQTTWLTQLAKIPIYNGLRPALITQTSADSASALLGTGEQVTLPLSSLSWAGKSLPNGHKGSAPGTVNDVLNVGDVVYLEESKNKTWRLSQVPAAEAALIAINPNNGAILALVGGFSYLKSSFDRVTQAERQPGSSFKPFLYSAALDKGFTLASLVNDAPIVSTSINQGDLWRPQNDSRTFNGPTRFRIGLAQSLNMVSIRILQNIGIDYAVDYLQRFGFNENDLPRGLSLALGVNTTTPLEMARGFAVFANGGFLIQPFFITKILDASGKEIFVANPQVIPGDTATVSTANAAPRAISAQNAYLMTSALQSVIQIGTGRAAKVLGRSDIAGKTGTSQNLRDAWFSGFNSDIVAIAWMGFDLQQQSLYEYGAQAALPMWVNFMRAALKNKPEHTMNRPEGLVTLRINPYTGEASSASDKKSIFETFYASNAPKLAPTARNPSDMASLSNSAPPLY